MKIYISGPMKHMKNGNRALFKEAEDYLNNIRGFEAVNPYNIKCTVFGSKSKYKACLREDIRELLDCDAICLIGTWPVSNGARVEVDVARAIGLSFYCYFDRQVRRFS